MRKKEEDTLEFASPDGKTRVWLEVTEDAPVTHLWLYTEQRSVLKSILADEEIGKALKPAVSTYLRTEDEKPFAWQLRLDKKHWKTVSKLEGIPNIPRKALTPSEKKPEPEGSKTAKETKIQTPKSKKTPVILSPEKKAKRIAPTSAPKTAISKPSKDLDAAIKAIVSKKKAEWKKESVEPKALSKVKSKLSAKPASGKTPTTQVKRKSAA